MSKVGSISTADSYSISLINKMFINKDDKPSSNDAVNSILNAVSKKNGVATSSSSAATYEDAVNTIKDAVEQNNAVQTSISEFSKLKSVYGDLSEDQQKELTDLLSTATTDLKSGDFDAETLTKKASASLKNALSNNGVDLKDALSSMQTIYNATSSSYTPNYSSMI